jgi:hypothetical protein
LPKIDVGAIRSSHPIPDVLKSRYGITLKNGKCRCPLPSHKDSDPSFSVFRKRDGEWRFQCHSTRCAAHAGGDVVEMVMAIEGLDFNGAVDWLTGGKPPRDEPGSRRPPPSEPAALPEPDWIPMPKGMGLPRAGVPFRALTKDGRLTKAQKVEAIYVYRNAAGDPEALVARIPLEDGGKKCLPLRWARDQGWTWGGYTNQTPRPLYGLDRLAAEPDKTVLVVEGEKCADAARVFDEYVVPVTWMGGSGQVRRVDWSPLAGRDVIFWQDNDEDGDETWQAFLEMAKPGRLRWVQYQRDQRPKGWDLADGLQEVTSGELWQWMLSVLRERTERMSELPSRRMSPSDWLPAGFELERNAQGGIKRASAINVGLMLEYHPAFAGRFTFDEFDQEVLIDGIEMTERGVMQVQRELVAQSHSLSVAADQMWRIITGIAEMNRSSSARAILESLPRWDGRHRVMPEHLSDGSRGLLPNYAPVKADPFTRIVGLRWLVGAVARIMKPGTQHDSILVLEGHEGLRKTSFFRALGALAGRDLYTELAGTLDQEKTVPKLRGKAIVELSEMTSHRKSEHDAFNAFVTSTKDTLRLSYARKATTLPRQCVFAGTTNRLSNWLTSPSGNRRIWPVRVEGQIDTDRIAADIEQIWAEALHWWRAGEPNWLQPGIEQEAWKQAIDERIAADPWEGLIVAGLGDKDRITWDQLWQAVGIENRDRNRFAMERLTLVMERLGYRYRQGTHPDNTRLWRRRRGRS